MASLKDLKAQGAIKASRLVESRIEECSKQLKELLATFPPRSMQRILAKCGLAEGFPINKDEGKLDLAELKVIQYSAMKNGMLANDAQMVRAFADFTENYEGREQLGDVTINIVPHDIPDTVPEALFVDANRYR